MDIFDDKTLEPMRIGREGKAFDDPAYLFELKLDGERCLAYLDLGHTTLVNRRGRHILPQFPELGSLHEQADRRCILDGEVVIPVGGRPDFGQIQRRSLLSDPKRIAEASRLQPAEFVAFDLLYDDGESLFEVPLAERKRRLGKTIADGGRMTVSRWVDGRGKDFFALTGQANLEGIVAKKTDSLYHPGKTTKDWVKIKNTLDDDFVICGYIQRSHHIISLILGQYTATGTLTYKGRVTLGASRPDFAIISSQRRLGSHPFTQAPPEETRTAVWLEPALVCTVHFLAHTPGGGLRQPVYKGLRDDKLPGEAVETLTHGVARAEN